MSTIEAKAILRSARISAQKVRLVADQVRGLPVGRATNLLAFSDKKAAVLASVPGTPRATEALIANAIPQTATITRSATSLTVNFDGSPQFRSIETTTLMYAANTTTPVIKADSHSYYAVQNGVWFVATSPIGPWAVALSVPVVIYTIPVSSPLAACLRRL